MSHYHGSTVNYWIDGATIIPQKLHTPEDLPIKRCFILVDRSFQALSSPKDDVSAGGSEPPFKKDRFWIEMIKTPFSSKPNTLLEGECRFDLIEYIPEKGKACTLSEKTFSAKPNEGFLEKAEEIAGHIVTQLNENENAVVLYNGHGNWKSAVLFVNKLCQGLHDKKKNNKVAFFSDQCLSQPDFCVGNISSAPFIGNGLVKFVFAASYGDAGYGSVFCRHRLEELRRGGIAYRDWSNAIKWYDDGYRTYVAASGGGSVLNPPGNVYFDASFNEVFAQRTPHP